MVDETRRATFEVPYADLESAVAVIQTIRDRVGGDQCAIDQLAAWMSYSSVDDGDFEQRMDAARIFGLAAISPNSVALTFLGQRMLDPEQRVESLVDAFIFVTLYQVLHDESVGQIPPSVSEIENFFEKMGIPLQHVTKARRAFRRSARQAGFREKGHDYLKVPHIWLNKNEIREYYSLEISEKWDLQDRDGGYEDFYVYILATIHGHYIGHTGRFNQRMKDHFTRDVPVTEGRELVWVSEKFNTRLEAAHYESYLKILRQRKRPEYKEITNLRPWPYKFTYKFKYEL